MRSSPNCCPGAPGVAGRATGRRRREDREGRRSAPARDAPTPTGRRASRRRRCRRPTNRLRPRRRSAAPRRRRGRAATGRRSRPRQPRARSRPQARRPRADQQRVGREVAAGADDGPVAPGYRRSRAGAVDQVGDHGRPRPRDARAPADEGRTVPGVDQVVVEGGSARGRGARLVDGHAVGAPADGEAPEHRRAPFLVPERHHAPDDGGVGPGGTAHLDRLAPETDVVLLVNAGRDDHRAVVRHRVDAGLDRRLVGGDVDDGRRDLGRGRADDRRQQGDEDGHDRRFPHARSVGTQAARLAEAVSPGGAGSSATRRPGDRGRASRPAAQRSCRAGGPRARRAR